MKKDIKFPGISDIWQAAEHIAPYALRTPVLHSDELDAMAGAKLVFKCENLQRTGSFKFRGACNAVWSLDDEIAQRGVITHSSGNHGAALALAAKTRGIPAHIVVPKNTVPSKISAVKNNGGNIYLCSNTLQAREETATQIQQETGANFIHPYTHPDVIAGQGTATLELIREVGAVDAIIAPISGGGLMGGTSIAAKALCPEIHLYAAEPEGAADTYESLKRGERVTNLIPDTICDGLRSVIGPINFSILQSYKLTVLPVSDDETLSAMRMLWERLKIIVEPSSATVFAAILRYSEHFAGKRVGLILSGGNLDLDRLPW